MPVTPWARLTPGLAAPLARLLDAVTGPLMAPIRSEIFGPQRFAEHGRSLGLTHEARRPGWADASFFPRLRGNIEMLRESHRAIAAQAAQGDNVSPASQWLLDNFHIIEAQLLAIHEGLPRNYFRALPVLVGQPLAGLPRVYGVAWAFVAHADSAYDEELLVHYLCAYQETRGLRLSEMWALPTTLRVVLVENLRRLAERVATNKAAREVANLCCDRIDASSAAMLQEIYERIELRGAGAAFLAQMGQRLQDRASGSDERVPAVVRLWLEGVLPNLAAVQAHQSAQQTADNLSVSNAMASLRAIGDADWSAIVGRSSPLMQLMLTSPLFAAEHVNTRDETLHGIERLSRQSRRSEIEVAKALLDRMNACADDAGGAVASHWLCGPGRPELTRALGLHRRWPQAWQTALIGTRKRLVLPLYLLTVLVGTSLLLMWLPHAGPTLAWPVLLLGIWPASEAVIALLHRLISESTRPRPLARLALVDGIGAAQRVMVVIPGMLGHSAAIDELAHRLQLHYLANPETEVQFALLTDWTDADTAQIASDAPLLEQATRLIAELNTRHARSGDPPGWSRFLLLHRQRRYSESERRWIGWERKRGKIEQIVALLASPPAGAPLWSTATGTLPLPDLAAAHVDGPADIPGEQPASDGDSAALPPPAAFIDLGPLSLAAPGTRYIVTLDSDTQLPPGRLRELVGMAAHPANRPRLSADGKRVVAGYGILQPRLVTPLPLPSEDTWFHRMFAGQCGIDPYSAASSEVYQDLFDEGSFTGKGLLDVQAMHAVLGGSLPEDQVLSHDLLEGALARCGAATDITLIEDAPFHAEVAASRVHRWTRGDWQLLPILLRTSPFVLPPFRSYPLGAVNRWKIADNLRRSMVPPVSLLLLLLALAGVVLAPGSTVVLVLAAFAAGPLLGALAGLIPSREAIAPRHFFRQAGFDLLRAACGGLWHLAMLLQHALLAVDAITRAVYRVVVSHHLLLQWTTAAAAQANASDGLPAALRRHWSVPLVALTIGLALWALGTPHPVWTAVLCLLWGAAPLWTWLVSRTGMTPQPRACSTADAAYLHDIARETWAYFERCVTAADHDLPPDNLQTQPYDMLARRTSPTNIGLYLLSVACAREFGWLDTPELLRRLQATLATLERLPRHRGHFLNWYDTQNCAALLPMYVSTVDSGNLCGHLLAVAQACRALARGPGGEVDAPALASVAERCEQFAWAADFSFLYHPRRHLLHIGYRVAEQQLDAGYYDLLASESRLTSLLAIAKGDVPVRHWAALGRPFYAVGAAAALRSWSGSMFEYLMPTLVLAEPHGSVLREAGLAALVEQRAFAERHGVPWGISESAHSGCDHTLAYQYAPQGVPRLALRRTPPDELVIACYATGLAAQLEPHRAALNYAVLQGLGARGSLGFIEALDYTPLRQTVGEAMTPVRTYMAHHQGMTLVALANVLLNGAPQRWGMANPSIEAVASLLHERAPREVSVLHALSPEAPQALQHKAPTMQRQVLPGRHAIEPTHLLSNGRYSVALRANGAGRSRCGNSDITRWRDDVLRDAYGSFLWLQRDLPGQRAGEPVSLTQHPAPDPHAEYSSVFHADRVCLDAHWPDLHSRVTVWVSPEDDIEFRRVELSNLGKTPIEIELISTFEPTLADPRADEAHPAFGNMFVQVRCDLEQQALLFERKPRLATEAGQHMAHFVAESGPQLRGLRHQVDRHRWLGRNRAPWSPRADLQDWPAGSAGAPDGATRWLDTGLDPMCALALRLVIEPGVPLCLTLATAACADAGTLHAVIDKYRQPSHIERALLMSATLAGIRLHTLRIGADTYTSLQSLTTALMYTLTRAPAAVVQVCDKRLLWRFGISGDRPIVLVSVAAVGGLGLVRSLNHALSLWSWGGVSCDLVVVNAEPASYEMGVQRELATLRDRHDGDAAARSGQAPCGWHLLRTDDLSADELDTLQCLARLCLLADGRSLVHHLDEWASQHEAALQLRHETSHTALSAAAWQAGEAAESSGRFAGPAPDRAGEFSFDVAASQRPRRPWINVMANAGFGSQVSEAGGGMSWAVNSRMNQLTPWSNDPVSDAPGEWLLLQDLRTREVWSLAPSAWGAAGAVYHVVHGQGDSVIRHSHGELEVTAHWCVDAVTAVKQMRLQVVNRGPRTRQLRLVAVAEWLLGAQRSDRASVTTSTWHHGLPGAGLIALLATQQERAAGFGGGTAFLAAVDPVQPDSDDLAANDELVDLGDWTCDRRECFDARGRPVLPDHFGQRHGSTGDPCAALALRLTVPYAASVERTLLLGWAPSQALARELAVQAASVPPAERLRDARSVWDRLLGATEVVTPDPLFDVMVNRWLLYQSVSCRLWAKAGFYQAGGATGFRDQLQDSMALAWTAPQMLRAQLLRCASRQFVEGDVQHWWHDPLGAGVRTHFSDDLLWLPYALAFYLRRTGDAGVLDEPVAFIEGLVIPPGAEDIYGTPAITGDTATVYEHAARTLDLSLRVGAHGLPLMGSGDWNDGMNRVGHEGRGESVWLAWFLCRVVTDFGPLARGRGDLERAQRWDDAATGWRAALESSAWDGAWYQRAFFDNGAPLGSQVNAEARIDLIAQAWAVLSGAAPPEHQHQALLAMDDQLVDREAGLIRLLTPPLVAAEPSAGYIQAYPAGVRENGGQYSHAGVWAMMAQLAHARVQAEPGPGLDLAWQYFKHLNPAHRAADATQGPVYGIEPYVMAGDVYTASPWVGRGGWSWYTGAAAWLHRAAIESMFGLALEARALSFAPALPPHWPRAELTLRRDGRTLHFLLLQATPEQALAMAAPWRQAQAPRLLLPGEQLDWTTERFDASFVVPLWPARAAAAAVSPAPMALARPTPAAAPPTVPSEAAV